MIHVRNLTAFLLAFLITAACRDRAIPATDAGNAAGAQQQGRATDIPFIIGEHYFVKNTIKSIPEPRIETAEAFGQYFGMATTMGPSGKPTAINFSRQFVIALMQPETDFATELEPVQLQKESSGGLLLTYRVRKGAKQTFTTVPSLVLVVDKQYSGRVVLKPL